MVGFLSKFFFQLENIFSSNSYSKDLEGKANDFSEKDEVDGGDKPEKVMSGYQPVPQHPPPGLILKIS